jgi:hypothetical protein
MYNKDDTVYIPPAASPKYHGIWTVDKVNPTTYVLKQEGRPRGLKAPHSFVEDVPEGMTQTAAGTAEDVPVGQPYREPFVLGAVVIWTRAPAKAGGQVFVVLKDDGGDTVTRIALLGGKDNRYWRNIPAAALREVDAVAVRKAALEA